MVAISFAGISSRGKEVMIGIFLLSVLFLLGVTGAPSQGNGMVVPIEYNWDPANPPLWSLRPEDRDAFTIDKSSAFQKRENEANIAGFTPLNYTWNPRDPPLWTIRPEDRKKYLTSSLGTHHIATQNIDDNSARDALLCLWSQGMPPKNKFLPFKQGKMRFDTCEGWNKNKYDDGGCTSFCETSTKFEWAQEVPFSHSECHYPIKCGMTETDSVNSGWTVGVGAKVQFWKALKIGVTGGWHHSWGTAKGKKWDVDLKEGECGYFTFVPVKKVVWYVFCKLLSLKDLIVLTCLCLSGGITEPSSPPGWGDFGFCNSYPRNFQYCDNQLWTIKDHNNPKDVQTEIPDGTIIFVYTDCLTRLPLPMSKQDPVYRAPGVALNHDILDSIQEGWVWNTCYLWDMGVKGQLSLYIHGSGFKDSMIGPKGYKLIERVSHCVRASEGVMKDVEFAWFHSGYPGDDAKRTGAVWVFMADVPNNIRPGCLGEAIMELGGTTMDNCVGDKFEQ
ncbi:hypothetical protein ColLi_01352 [Colletotrichum liriopes]|uniref:Uncharacterized protein n=1 Tax=Colletotrichum liriopes TaxID=708192 RepID=A0AA37GD61_9PEZI|nr:hypothetical protein ColLi_01352 [Colletotrichum liriopes]